MIVVACCEEGAGNDSEALELAFYQAQHSLTHLVKLLQIWLIETLGGVMICYPRRSVLSKCLILFANVIYVFPGKLCGVTVHILQDET